jgi:hypothetical protein
LLLAHPFAFTALRARLQKRNFGDEICPALAVLSALFPRRAISSEQAKQKEQERQLGMHWRLARGTANDIIPQNVENGADLRRSLSTYLFGHHG